MLGNQTSGVDSFLVLFVQDIQPVVHINCVLKPTLNAEMDSD